MEIIDTKNHEKPVVELTSNDVKILTDTLKKAKCEENVKLVKRIEELKIKVGGKKEVQFSKHEVSLLQKALEANWKDNYSDKKTRKLLEKFDLLRSQISTARFVNPNDLR